MLYLPREEYSIDTELEKLTSQDVVDALCNNVEFRQACVEDFDFLRQFIPVIEENNSDQFNFVVIFPAGSVLPPENNGKPIISRIGRGLSYKPRSMKIGHAHRALDLTVPAQTIGDSNRDAIARDIQYLIQCGCTFKYLPSVQAYFAFRKENGFEQTAEVPAAEL